MRHREDCQFCYGLGFPETDGEYFWVECEEELCGFRGPRRETEDLAVVAWNEINEWKGVWVTSYDKF